MNRVAGFKRSLAELLVLGIFASVSGFVILKNDSVGVATIIFAGVLLGVGIAHSAKMKKYCEYKLYRKPFLIIFIPWLLAGCIITAFLRPASIVVLAFILLFIIAEVLCLWIICPPKIMAEESRKAAEAAGEQHIGDFI